MELTEEEHAALKKADEWLKSPTWQNNEMEDGYYEACVLANLLDRFGKEVTRILGPMLDSITQ